MKIRSLLKKFCITLCIVNSLAFTVACGHTSSPSSSSPHSYFEQNKQLRTLSKQADGLDSKVLKLGLRAYYQALSKGIADKQYLTIIDYSKPSSKKRLWVFDLGKNKLLFHTLVSHGVNSGEHSASYFSNAHESRTSSIGVFKTDESYFGKYGYSLRITGLEKNINDNARARAIVFHPAKYVTEDFVKRTGRLGLSWGCPALDPSVSEKIIDTIKQGSLVFTYHPQWLSSSKFLQVG